MRGDGVDAANYVCGERSTNCSNNGEYWALMRHNGTSWVSWSRNRNWNETGVGFDWDTDDYYKYIPKSNTEGWIRPGSG